MGKSLVGVLFLAAMVLIATSPAKASKTELTITSDGSTYDSGASSNSSLATSLTDFDGWDVTLVAGSSNSPSTTPYGLSLISVSASCAVSSCESNPLTIEFSGSGFTETTPTPPDFNVSYTVSGESAGSSTTLTGYYGHGLLDTAHQIGSPLTLTGPVTIDTIATTGGHAPNTPYSLTLTDTFTAGSDGATFFESTGLLAAAPEPATMLLFGTGLLLFGLVLRKRLRV